jgi:transposase
LTDAECRPLSFLLTGGQVADCTAVAELLARLPPCQILHADKGYDSNAIRSQVEERGAMPNIPPKANRKWKNCFSPFLYRAQRNRTHVLPLEGLQARGDALRSKRRQLPRSRRHRSHRQLLVVNPDPKS